MAARVFEKAMAHILFIDESGHDHREDEKDALFTSLQQAHKDDPNTVDALAAELEPIRKAQALYSQPNLLPGSGKIDAFGTTLRPVR